MTSFVSRLAPLNRIASARRLCTDLGLEFQSIVDGDNEQIEALAYLVDASPNALMTGVIQKHADSYVLRGERLLKPFLRREHLHVCPECLKDDIASSDLPPRIAARGRVTWLLTAIRTCPTHGVALVEAATAGGSQGRHDFAMMVGSRADDIGRLAAGAASRVPSSLETYLLDRLEGATGRFPWLDGLEFHAAAKTCEMFGAVALYGRTPNLKTLSEDQWQGAGGAGFEICAQGEAGVREFLSYLWGTYPFGRSGNEGPSAVLGRVYHWLSFSAQDCAYGPVRHIVRKHIIETMPVGTEDEIFGAPVEKRVIHSIRSASVTFGLHPRQLRKILTATGIVDGAHRSLPDNLVMFDAERAEDTLARTVESMTRKEAGAYIGADRVQITLLEQNGFIKPFVPWGNTAKIKGNLFAKRDLDAFVAGLGQGAASVEKAEAGMLDIPAAAKRSRRSAAEIIRLILDGKLERTERFSGRHGYMSILVNLDEVKSKLAAPLEGMTAFMIQKELGKTHRVVSALLAYGHLPCRTTIHPTLRRSVKVVSREDFEAFRAEYVSLSDLGRERGVHHLKLKAELTELGISPAMDGEKYGATFYRRSDLG